MDNENTTKAIDHPILKMTIPKELRTEELLDIIHTGVEQWSRITAWTWSSCLAFAGESTEKVEQEKALKALLIKTLQNQAQSADAFISYGNSKSEDKANTLAEDIKNLLLSRNDKVSKLYKDPNITLTLTLDKLYQKLTGDQRRLITTEDATIEEMFLVRVITNAFSGSIDYALDECGKRIPNKYVFVIAYPPRPALSEVTVTEQQLTDWAFNITPGGSYLPPSPYIPIAGT